MHNGKKQSHFWDIQVSIANASAKSPHPSLMEMHHEIIEEMGHAPGLDLVDYFVGIAKISSQEVDTYFSYIGRNKQKPDTKTNIKPSPKQFTEKIATHDNPTILKFRQSFIQEYGEPPPDRIIEYFLQQIQIHKQKRQPIKHEKQGFFDFAEKMASSNNPTVLKFRDEYNKQFGGYPANETITYFLKQIQVARNTNGKNSDFESKANFTKTVANGLVSTVPQFQITYEKVYGEPPTAELIRIFKEHQPPQHN